MVTTGAKFMWVAHLFEAGYTITLARRYKTTFTVGVRSIQSLNTKIQSRLRSQTSRRCMPSPRSYSGGLGGKNFLTELKSHRHEAKQHNYQALKHPPHAVYGNCAFLLYAIRFLSPSPPNP